MPRFERYSSSSSPGARNSFVPSSTYITIAPNTMYNARRNHSVLENGRFQFHMSKSLTTGAVVHTAKPNGLTGSM